MATVRNTVCFLTLLMVSLTQSLVAQSTLGYSIDGADIIFNFNLADYKEVTVNGSDVTLKIDDIKLRDIAVAGTFNDWSGKGWKLERVNEQVYELRKKVKDLNASSGTSFKFLINDRFWVEPPAFASNRSISSFNDLFTSVYNLDMNLGKPDKSGNHLFYLAGHQDAESVIVSGTFNYWDEHDFTMKWIDGAWQLRVKLPPGEHQYRFIVDGNWMEDPANPNRVENEFGEHNSLVSKHKMQQFTLKDKGYKDVYLAGDFSNWQYGKIAMRRENDYWKLTLPLPYGRFHYKFITDDSWILDPTNETTEFGEGGHLNSVIFIK